MMGPMERISYYETIWDDARRMTEELRRSSGIRSDYGDPGMSAAREAFLKMQPRIRALLDYCESGRWQLDSADEELDIAAGVITLAKENEALMRELFGDEEETGSGTAGNLTVEVGSETAGNLTVEVGSGTAGRPGTRPGGGLAAKLGVVPGITSVIGSGGKTTLLRRLAGMLDGTVLLATTTNMQPLDEYPMVIWTEGAETLPEGSGECFSPVPGDRNGCESAGTGTPSEGGKAAGQDITAGDRTSSGGGKYPGIIYVSNKEDFLDALKEAFPVSRVVCIGSLALKDGIPNGKLAAVPMDLRDLTDLADYILVEADGSKRLPVKAHKPWEPVIPEGSSNVICVVGASGFGRPIGEVCHRADAFCEITGAAEEDAVTPELVGKVIRMENLADRIYLTQVNALREEDVPAVVAALEEAAGKNCVYGKSRGN